MPKKLSKWGMKAWAFAEAKTDYLYNWKLYLGTHRVVTSLAYLFYNHGQVIYMDFFFFFTSPKLFAKLSEKDMGACSTPWTNCLQVPAEIKNAKLQPNDSLSITKHDGNSLFLSWCNMWTVNQLTTCDQTFRKEVQSKHHQNHVCVVDKPYGIKNYTRNLGGVNHLLTKATIF